jgi:hypothetical protein
MMLNSRADTLLMARQRALELIRVGQPHRALFALATECCKHSETRGLTYDYAVMLPGMLASANRDEAALRAFIEGFVG